MAVKQATFAVLMFAALGCDPPIDVLGNVETTSGRPVAGATVRLTCSKVPRLSRRIVTSNQTGHFLLEEMGCLPRECTIIVRHPDGRRKAFSANEYCESTKWLACRPKYYCNKVVLRVVFSDTRTPE